jgi:CDP-diacylglycerol--serine O-phosphatidyltransferase
MAARALRPYIDSMPMTPSERDRPEARRLRFRAIPVRVLLPNMITLVALFFGLTAIRLAVDGNFKFAVAWIVIAAILDGIDGRVARMIKGQSRFGAELDSLVDFVNFGVAPGLILYFWGLNQLGDIGWIAAIAFAVCAGLRLARFNVALDDPNRPAWMSNFFTGMPAPMGAITVLLPMYIYFLGLRIPAVLTFFYTLAIAFLMMSWLPVFSGKKLGTRVPPEMVLPVVVLVVLSVVVLITFPWQLLTIGTLAYLAALPLSWLAAREYRRKDAAAAASPQSEPARPAESAPSDSAPSPTARSDSERLTRH